MVQDIAYQALLAVLYYIGLVVVMRVAGKRLAGQTTTFDLVVLIQMAVVLQSTAFREGPTNAVVFLVTVLTVHRLTSWACARSAGIRHVLRGSPRRLIERGTVLEDALAQEKMSRDDLLAGLRKLGFGSPEEVELAVLEETGHVSAVRKAA